MALKSGNYSPKGIQTAHTQDLNIYQSGQKKCCGCLFFKLESPIRGIGKKFALAILLPEPFFKVGNAISAYKNLCRWSRL